MQRRRMIQMLAAPVLSPLLVPVLGGGDVLAAHALKQCSWRGVVLGAPAQISLYVDDEEYGEHSLREMLEEIRRLENVFSLYRETSSITLLNRKGRLQQAPSELVELLKIARHVSELTSGRFDATVQPLWELYSDYSDQGRTTYGATPDEALLESVLSKVDYRKVNIESGKITFEQAGMAITLNGIAQGFITEHIANMLRLHGFEHVLVDLGEIGAVGSHPDQQPWRVGIQDPLGDIGLAAKVGLQDRAIATSSTNGHPFSAGKHGNPSGLRHHLFNPLTGRTANLYGSVSVVATSATWADGLSTAFSSMDMAEIENVVTSFEKELNEELKVIVVRQNGSIKSLGSADVNLTSVK